jgi:hypothetical protein
MQQQSNLWDIFLTSGLMALGLMINTALIVWFLMLGNGSVRW